MTVQEIVVVCVVAGAIYYLYRRLFPGRASAAPAQFIPLSRVKRRQDRNPGCH